MPAVSTDGGDALQRSSGLRTFNRLGCLALIALVLMLPVIGYFQAVREAGSDLAALKKRLTAEGILVPVEQLIPKVPKGEQNAADLYLLAFNALQTPVQQLDIVHNLPSGSPKRLRFLRRVVAQNTAGLRLLEEASRLTYCAFPINWNDPYALPSHHSKVRSAGMCMLDRAELLMADGDLDAALDSTGTMLRMATHVGAEPTLFAQLGAAWFLENLAIGAASETLGAGSPSPAACQRLFEEIGRVDNRRDYARSLRGDLMNTVGQHVFGDLAGGKGRIEDLRGPGATDELLVWSSRLLRRFAFARDEIHYLTVAAACVRTADRESADAVKLIQGALDALRGAPQIESMASRWMVFMPGAEVPLPLSTAILCNSRTASLRAAQVALASVAFQAEKGRYPNSLAELHAAGWKLPRDPFGGSELRYRREKQGFVVYSLGPNMADDNATEYDSKTMSYTDGPYDIVFRVKR